MPKSYAQIALEDMRRPGFPTPYLQSYAVNEVRPLGRSVASYSRQSDSASLVMGRYADARAFNPSINPDYGEIGWRSPSLVSDLASRSWGEILLWNQITCTEESGLDHEPGWINNTRVGCWGFEVWLRRPSGWGRIVSVDDWQGETWSPTFRTQGGAGTADVRVESGSGIRTARIVYSSSEPFGTGYWMYHGYAGGIQPFNPAELLDVAIVMRFALFVHNPALPDDRQFARFGIAGGADYYPTPRIFDYPGVGTSRNRLVRAHYPEWQALIMHTLTEQQIQSVGLPPGWATTFENFELGGAGGGGGIGGGAGGGGGGITPPPGPITPPGPAPTRGQWADVFSPSSPRGQWIDVGASSDSAPVWAPAALRIAVIGQAFSFTPRLVSGTPAPTFAKVSGPAWASVNPTTGAITGTPSGSPGTETVVVSANNGAGPAANLSVSIDVRSPAAPPAWVTPAALPPVQQGTAWEVLLEYTGEGTFTITQQDGAWPENVTRIAETVRGVPLTVGTGSVTLVLSNGIGSPVTRTFTWTVTPAPEVAPPADGWVRLPRDAEVWVRVPRGNA